MNTTGRKVLVIDDVHSLLVDGLVSANFEVIYRPDILSEEVAVFIVKEGVSGLVVRSKMRLTATFFDTVAHTLQWVGRAGAGLDNIDLSAAEKQGIYCFNSGEANSVAVGEHTLGMLLGLLHRLGKGNLEVRNGIWDREGNRGDELSSMVVGVLGYGNTGSAVCKRLLGFGCQVIAIDKYKQGFAKPWNVEQARQNLGTGVGEIFEGSWEAVYAHAKVLSLHVPLTEETKFTVNSHLINQFVHSFWLLNISRGEVVDTDSVCSGLSAGKILGFGADVLECEPPMGKLSSFGRLAEFSNVIFSPHVGGWTRESYRKISEVLLAKVLAYYGIEP